MSFVLFYLIHVLVISGYEHAFEAFERIQCTRKTTMTIIRKITPNIWSILQSHFSYFIYLYIITLSMKSVLSVYAKPILASSGDRGQIRVC